MNANESKGVLAVMDGHVEAIKNLCEPVGVIESYKLREARSAVAELIEAARDVAFVQINRRTPANDLGKAKQLRLRAALTRAGGAE